MNHDLDTVVAARRSLGFDSSALLVWCRSISVVALKEMSKCVTSQLGLKDVSSTKALVPLELWHRVSD